MKRQTGSGKRGGCMARRMHGAAGTGRPSAKIAAWLARWLRFSRRCSKRRRRCVAYRLSGHLIDLGRGKTHLDHLVYRRHHPKNADAVGDKIRTVFCCDDTLAETLIEKTRHFARDLAAGF